MDRTTAGIRLSRHIKEFENELDTLLAKAASLTAEVAEARLLYNESALSTQRPIARLHSMQNLLVQARSKACGIHADLAKISAGNRDIPTDCPPNCFETQPSLVAEAKAA
jgi:hypothetical protein